MTEFTIHTAQTAPERARPILEGAEKALGFVPNLYGVLAESPAALEAYTTLSKIFETSSFDATERQIVYLTTNFENGCNYCMAAHSFLADMQKIDPEVTAALRDGRPIADPKLNALSQFTAQVHRNRGWVSDADTEAFLNAGYTTAHVIEVLLGVAHKTLSNYVNHLAKTPVDDAFAGKAWTKPEAVPAE